MVHPGRAARVLQKDRQLQLQRRSRELIVFDSLFFLGLWVRMEIAVRGSIFRSFRSDKPLDDPFLGKPRSNSSCELTRVEKG